VSLAWCGKRCPLRFLALLILEEITTSESGASPSSQAGAGIERSTIFFQASDEVDIDAYSLLCDTIVSAMKVLLLFSTVMAASQLLAQQAQLDPEKVRATNVQKWTEFYSSLARRENVCLVAPILAESHPPAPFKNAYGVETLPMLQFVAQARCSIEEGTLVVRPWIAPPNSMRNSGVAFVGKWLTTATDAEVSAAIGREGLNLGSMAVSERLDALASIGLSSDVTEGFVANGAESTLRVRFAIEIRGVDATGRTVRYTIRPGGVPNPDGEDLNPPTFSSIPAEGLLRDGDIDFRDGRTVSVRELKDLLYATFQRVIVTDVRLDDGLIFLAGKFTFEELLAAVQFALSVDKPQEPDAAKTLTPEELDELIQNRLAELFEQFQSESGIDPEWALERRKMSAVVLAEKDAGFRKYLESRGIDPSTLAVDLVPSLTFHASAPGTSTAISADPSIPPSRTKHSFGFSIHPGRN
jgi:hypothetical protein